MPTQVISFTFLKTNDNYSEYQLTIDEMTNNFNKWLFTKTKTWLYETPHYIIIGLFIAEETGLNSVPMSIKKDMPIWLDNLKNSINEHCNR